MKVFLCLLVLISFSLSLKGQDQPLQLPDPLRIITVTNANEFNTALANAEPGDHIELKAGVTYKNSSGSFSLSRSGTPETPIVIRSEGEPTKPEMAATLVSGLDLAGDHIWLYRLHVRKAPVSVRKDYNVLWRSWFIGYEGVIITATLGSSCGRVENCLIQGPPASEAPDSSANRGVFGHGSEATKDWIIRRTHFKDIRRPTDPNNSYLGGAIGFGHNVYEFVQSYNWLIEYCLFENIETDQTVVFKGSDNIIRFCVFDNVQFVANRGGLRNKFHALHIRNSGGMWINDDETELLGIIMENSGSIQLLAGTANRDTNPYRIAAHFPARRTTIAGCRGDIQLGRFFSDWTGVLPVSEISIEGCVNMAGQPILEGTDLSQTQYVDGFSIKPETVRDIPEIVTLNAFDVGPNGGIDDPEVIYTSRLQMDANSVLYEDAELAYSGGQLSVGRKALPDNMAARALVRVKLPSEIPSNARIRDVRINLITASRGPLTEEGDLPVSVHRVLTPWSEGILKGYGSYGSPVEEGSTTWLHSDFPDHLWENPGGDYLAAESASLTLGPDVEAYQAVIFSGQGLCEDVQSWLSIPGTNHGWLLKSDETVSGREFAFHGRTARSESSHPFLEIDYSIEALAVWGHWKAENLEGDYEDKGGLGWVNILQAPWIYSYSIGWVFVPEATSNWIFFPRI